MNIEHDENIPHFEMLEIEGDTKTSLTLTYVYATDLIELKVINGNKATLCNLDKKHALELVNAITQQIL